MIADKCLRDAGALHYLQEVNVAIPETSGILSFKQPYKRCIQ
jgi:hypothetical protein